MGWLRVAMAAVLFVAVTLVLLPLQLFAVAFDLKLARSLPRLWHRIMCPVLGLKVRVHGTPDARRPLMLVANHVSWKDIVALGSVADVVYVAKAEVRNWPVFGWLARLQRSVFVERENRRRTGHQITEISRRLHGGEVVVLFAEGTTSDGNRVLDFKSSLLGAATAALGDTPDGTVLLQPVAIAYTRIHGMAMGRQHRTIASWPGDVGIGPHLIGILREGGIDVDISFGPALAFDRSTNRKTATQSLRSVVRDMLSARLRGR